MNFQSQLVHFRSLFGDQGGVRVPFVLLFQHNLIGGLDTSLELLVLFIIKGSKILGAFEHHVLQQMGNAGFAGFFEGRTCSNRKPDGNLRGSRAFDHQKQHAVFELEVFDINFEVISRFRRRDNSAEDQQNYSRDKQFINAH